MVNDPISDLIIQIKNAGLVGKPSVVVPYSKLKHAVADLLVKEGYVESVLKKGKKVKKLLEITLNYIDGKHKIKGVERISKLSQRMYVRASNIPQIKGGNGTLILSTPNGVMTDREARAKHVGGEMLFKVW